MCIRALWCVRSRPTKHFTSMYSEGAFNWHAGGAFSSLQFCAQHGSTSVNVTTPSDLPLSSFTCTGAHAHARRCVITNAVIIADTIWLLMNSGQINHMPKTLCSAIDDAITETRVYCHTRSVSREDFFRKFGGSTECALTFDTGLAFGRLSPQNLYHTLFEDMIPAFDIISSSPELSSWLKPAQSERRLLYFQEDKGHDISFRMWHLLFPHIDQLSLNNVKKGASTTKIRFVRTLVAGSNASCAHYFHCSRGAYATDGIAVKFRQYVLSTVYLIERTVSTLKPVVTIVQREGGRRIANLPEVYQAIKTVTGVEPRVVDYGNLPITQQIALTMSTDVLVMVHGGALGHMLFMAHGALLVDVYPYNYPFQFHGLVNWVRASLESVHISHAPFDVTRSSDMQYTDGALPEDCLCDASSRSSFYGCAIQCFYTAKSLTVDIQRFLPHFSSAISKWLNGSSYAQPLSRDNFRSTHSLEPWYYASIRTRQGDKPPPMCLNKDGNLDLKAA